jgi:hypothetical protein
MGNKYDYNKKTERWKAWISEFDIKYNHIQGNENLIADELSRDTELKDSIVMNVNDLNTPFGPITFKSYILEFHITNGHPELNRQLKPRLK